MREECAECGTYTENPHADYAPSPTTVLCCECFQAWYPSHDSCGELEQEPEPEHTATQVSLFGARRDDQ
jgi:hypothetical protein